MDRTPNLGLSLPTFKDLADIREIASDNRMIDNAHKNVLSAIEEFSSTREIKTYFGMNGLLGKPYDKTVTWAQIAAAMPTGSILTESIRIDDSKTHELFKTFKPLEDPITAKHVILTIEKQDHKLLVGKLVTDAGSDLYLASYDSDMGAGSGWHKALRYSEYVSGQLKTDQKFKSMYRSEIINVNTGNIDGLSTQTVPVMFNIPSGYSKVTGTIFCGNGWAKPSWSDWNLTGRSQAINVFNGANSPRNFDISIYAIYVSSETLNK